MFRFPPFHLTSSHFTATVTLGQRPKTKTTRQAREWKIKGDGRPKTDKRKARRDKGVEIN